MAKLYNKTFSGKLEALAVQELNESSRVNIAKKSYLMKKKDDILQAIEEGYNYILIAEVATEELLETGIPKSITVTTKEGAEVSREVKFIHDDIRKFIEEK